MVGRHTRRPGSGWEPLPEGGEALTEGWEARTKGREWSGALPKGQEGQEAITESQELSGGPPGGLGVVGRPYRRAGSV